VSRSGHLRLAELGRIGAALGRARRSGSSSKASDLARRHP